MDDDVRMLLGLLNEKIASLLPEPLFNLVLELISWLEKTLKVGKACFQGTAMAL